MYDYTQSYCAHERCHALILATYLCKSELCKTIWCFLLREFPKTLIVTNISHSREEILFCCDAASCTYSVCLIKINHYGVVML